MHMERMEKQEVHKDKIQYYLSQIMQKVVDLQLLKKTLSEEQLRTIAHEILALDMSLRSNLAAEKKTLEEAGIKDEYESLMRTKEKLLENIPKEEELLEAA